MTARREDKIDKQTGSRKTAGPRPGASIACGSTSCPANCIRSDSGGSVADRIRIRAQNGAPFGIVRDTVSMLPRKDLRGRANDGRMPQKLQSGAARSKPCVSISHFVDCARLALRTVTRKSLSGYRGLGQPRRSCSGCGSGLPEESGSRPPTSVSPLLADRTTCRQTADHTASY